MRKRNIVIRTWLIVLLLFKFGKRSEGAPLVFASFFSERCNLTGGKLLSLLRCFRKGNVPLGNKRSEREAFRQQREMCIGTGS